MKTYLSMALQLETLWKQQGGQNLNQMVGFQKIVSLLQKEQMAGTIGNVKLRGV